MSQSLAKMRDGFRKHGIDEKTAKNQLFWARSFLIYNGNAEPEDLNRSDVETFLAHLSEQRHADQPALSRALEAIRLLYCSSASGEPSWLKVLIETRSASALPNVLSREEVQRLLAHLKGTEWLVAALIYGTGIRLLECVRLRTRDIDLDAGELLVRDGTDRVRRRLKLPENLPGPLAERLNALRQAHLNDIAKGCAHATLPPPIAMRKPGIGKQWGWQYLFPKRLVVDEPSVGGHDPDSHPTRAIHHQDPQTLHRKIERAAIEANIYRRVTGHVLRNSFALHMVEQGVPVARVEQMLGTRKPDPQQPGSDDDQLVDQQTAGHHPRAMIDPTRHGLSAA
ncbi:MAG: tyrosine-type recombinase/integrase [Xanthomonadaceae bacterium]|nr:tyrosine-type recombinase/integrase [Xanthomonadaceae bacterium]